MIGSDLIVGAVAALDRFRPPLIIFDLGTTTTISVIDKQGVYRGGAFLPGIQISWMRFQRGLPSCQVSALTPPAISLQKIQWTI